MTLRYRLLGSLCVERDGKEISIGAAKQRVLLALLLINANQTVPMDSIIYELWGESPPATAIGTIQSLVSRLRRSLEGKEAVGRWPLIRRPEGYELEVSDGELDLISLDRAAQEIRKRLTQDLWREAMKLIEDALQLWRGSALAGVPTTPRIFAEAARLEELRFSLLDQQTDIRLEAGEYSEVISLTRSLLVDHPLRERLWWQLMLALYRSGRQADALKTYREARDCLISELGVEPGSDLQQLHQEMLAGHILAPERDGSMGTISQVRPSQLPTDISDFTGRKEDVATASQLLMTRTERQAVTVVAVSGMAGVGKTTFSLHVAHSVLADFPDGQLYVDLRGDEAKCRDPGEVLASFLRAVGTEGGDISPSLEERMVLYRSSLAGRRMLLVLDNAADERQIEWLLPGSPTCAVIVTSRKRLSGLSGACHIDLDVLPEGESLEFLKIVVGADRISSDPQAARRLIRLCGHHPLSLRICATRLATRSHWTLDSFTGKLIDKRLRLDQLGYGTMNVRASFSLSYESLTHETQQLFCRLGLLNVPDFAAWVAAPLLNCSVERADEQVDLLVESRLLEVIGRDRTGKVRYRFHDLIHCYSRELAVATIGEGERGRILGRLLGAWLMLAERAHEQGYGANFMLRHGDAPRWSLDDKCIQSLLEDPWLWWDTERVSLVSMIHLAADEGMHEACWDLAATSTSLFGIYGYLDDWEDTHAAALSVTRRYGNRCGEAMTLSHTGGLRILQRRFEDAVGLFRCSVEILSGLGEIRGRAFAYIGLGIAERGRRDLQSSLRHFRAGLDLLIGTDEPLSQAHAFLHMGQTYLSMGDLAMAERHLVRSRDLARVADGIPMAGYVCHWLGEVSLAQKDPIAARDFFLNALSLILPSRDARGEVSALRGLVRAHREMGERVKAETFLMRAAGIANGLPEGSRTARILAEIGSLFFEQGNVHQAIDFYQKAVEMFSAAGDRQLAEKWLRHLAEAYQSIGRPNQADPSAERASGLLSSTSRCTG